MITNFPKLSFITDMWNKKMEDQPVT